MRFLLILALLAAIASVPSQPVSSDRNIYERIGRHVVYDRRLAPGLVSSIGVLGKEFAAAPLWIVTWYHALERRWRDALETCALALMATLVWMLLQTTMMTLYNYSYGDNRSPDLLHGA